MSTPILTDGGLILWILLFMGAIAAVTFLNKMFHLHRAQIPTREFLQGIKNVVRQGNLAEAVDLCRDTPGPVAAMVRTALLRMDYSMDDITRELQSAGIRELPRLEKNIVVLGTLGKLAPLLGLLGTFLGMIDAWLALQTTELASRAAMSAPVLKALYTSALGLAVSIPCYAGYNFLVSRVQDIVMDMELVGADLLSFLSREKFRREHTEEQGG